MSETRAPSKRIRVLCIDDHRLVLEGIAAILSQTSDLTVEAMATTGEEGLALFRQYRPEVSLVDLELPSLSGLETIKAIRNEDVTARIVVVTMHQGDEDVYRALQAGAVTYVLKETLSGELVRIIREVHAGGRPLPSNVAEILAARGSRQSLSGREIGVLELAARGMRNKEIAAALSVSEETVKSHIKSVLSKLQVHDRVAAIAVGLQRGIIHRQE